MFVNNEETRLADPKRLPVGCKTRLLVDCRQQLGSQCVAASGAAARPRPPPHAAWAWRCAPSQLRSKAPPAGAAVANQQPTSFPARQLFRNCPSPFCVLQGGPADKAPAGVVFAVSSLLRPARSWLDIVRLCFEPRDIPPMPRMSWRSRATTVCQSMHTKQGWLAQLGHRHDCDAPLPFLQWLESVRVLTCHAVRWPRTPR